MYSTKLISKLSFLIGIIIVVVGIYMKTNDIFSKGEPYRTRLGTYVKAETINGNGTILLGLILLLASFIAHRVYVKEKKIRDKKRLKENLTSK